MQTAKDGEIVCWIGQVGAASAQHVMARFGMGRSWAYARLHVLVRDGLLVQQTLLHRQPGLYIATPAGLRFTRQPRLGVCRISPGSVQHASELTSAAVALHHRLPDWQLLSERELRVRERDRGRLIASALLGESPGARPALHRPDLALIAADGDVCAIEVELSIKAPVRLRAICRAYGRARHLRHVYYLAPPAVARALGRAVEEVRVPDVVTVLALHDFDGLANAVREGARDAEG